MDIVLEKYKAIFGKLNISHRQGVKAPHKAILLLSVMRMIEKGELPSNRVYYSELLKRRFKEIWAEYIGDSPLFNPEVAMPFWYLKSEEEVWKLKPKASAPDGFESMVLGSPQKAITQYVDYAVIPEELFLHLQSPASRALLAEVLFEQFIYI